MTRLALILALLPGPALSHDWLAGKRNNNGDSCCYSTADNGRVPDCWQTEAEPEGAAWDKKPRCVFGPRAGS